MTTDAWVKRLNTKRGQPYFYLEGPQAVRAGFSSGQKFDVAIEDQRVVLTVNKDGSRTVSSKKRSDKDHPVIDINSKELLSIFDGMSAIRIIVQKGRVYLLPLASEIKKVERIKRITDNITNNVPLTMGSISHGGGVLSHALHTGLVKAGLAVNLAFANEIREDLLLQAIEHNDAWSDKTVALSMPMQELAQDDWLLSQLPLLDILELGLPCSGSSKAGASKLGLKMMEDHETVGHLAFSALVILNKVQPGVVLFENVVEYSKSASASILRKQLRDMGYVTHEAVLSGKDFGCLENRVRWCMVAATKGLDFSFENLVPVVTIVKKLGDALDASIENNDPRYRGVPYLKVKQERDADKGNSFTMQFVGPNSTSIPTIRKGYQKGGSTDPRLLCPDNPELSRLLTAAEHARIKEVPAYLIEGLSETLAHELLGQGIAYAPFEAVGQRIGESLAGLINGAIDVDDEQEVYSARPCG